MKTILKALTIFLFITFLSCEEQQTLEYKHADKVYNVTCDSHDTALLKEALYTFEEDIINFYDKDNRNSKKAYSTFIRTVFNRQIDLKSMISEHTVEVFNALNKKPDLWSNKHLNYNSELVKCLGEHINDNEIKSSFNALVSTNSMRPDLLGGLITSKYQQVESDKYLGTYIALDLYYAKLLDLDLTKIDFNNDTSPPPLKQTKVDFNKVPRKQAVQ